ncbi:MAG: VWA domain-containing protein [Edaphobacter sp.]
MNRFTGYFLRRLMLVLAVLLSVQFVDAQQSNATDQKTSVPTLNVASRLVLVDVVVTDKGGNPVTNLTKDDFVVYEDKVQQRVVSFEPPSSHTLPVGSDNRSLDPDDPKSFGQSPVTILVLDELNTHFEDSSFAVRSVRQYLESRPAVLSQPTTLMVVSDNKFRVLQNFTRDRSALLKALTDQSVHYAWKLEGDKSIGYGTVERLDQSLSALEQIAQATARIPGRKNLVWVGQGFPTLDPTELDTKDQDLVDNTIQHVTDVLLDTRVTLYAVDPTSSAAGMAEITDPTQLEFAQLAGDALAGNADPFSSKLDFDRLGPVTGGRVLRGKNDIDKQIALSVELGTKFYTIGYSPSNASSAERKYRNIHIACLRPDLTVTARNGYYATPPASQNSKETLIYDLNTAALSSIPLTALKVTVEPSKKEAASTDAYTVHVDVSTLKWQSTNDGVQSTKVAVLVVGLSSTDKILTHTLLSMSAIAKTGADLEPGKMADFMIATPAPKGVVRLRFVVRETETGRMGTADLAIPR